MRFVKIGYLFCFTLGFQNNLLCQEWLIPFPETCDFFSESPEGLMYLGTTHQAYTFDGTNIVRKKLIQSGSPNIQSNFYFDQFDKIWFCNYESLVCFDKKTQKSISFQIIANNNSKLTSDYYCFGWAVPNKRLWVKQGFDIYLFDLISKQFIPVASNIKGKRIKVNDKQNQYYAYYHTYHPSVIQTDSGHTKVTAVKSWTNWPLNCLLQDILIMDDGKLIMFGDKGLFLGDPLTLKVQEIFWQKRPVQNFLCAIQIDEFKVLASTSEHGLIWIYFDKSWNIINIHAFRNMDIKDPVQRMYKTKEGNILLSSYSKFIAVLNPDQFKFNDYQFNGFEALSPVGVNGNILMLAKDFKFYHWFEKNRWKATPIVAERSLEIQNNNLPYFYFNSFNAIFHQVEVLVKNGQKIEELPKELIFRFFQSAEDDKFLCTTDRRVLKYNKDYWTEMNIPNLQSKIYHYVNAINRKYLITGLNEELIRIHPYDDPQNIIFEIPFIGDLYNQIYDSTRNTLYLSSSVGFLSLSLDNFELNSLDDGDTSYDNACLCIVSDAKGKIWGSRKSGLFQFDPLRKSMNSFWNQSKNETGKFLPGACGVIKGDSIFFSGTHKLCTFNPTLIANECTPPRVYLNQLIVNYQLCAHADTLSILDSLVLPYQKNTLGFTVNAIHFNHPEACEIQYYLSPIESFWNRQKNSNAAINYIKLKPGKYTFYYKAVYEDKLCESSMQALPIEILTPFWMTDLFRLSILFAVLLISFFGFNIHYQRQLEKKDLLLREQRLVIEKQLAIENERNRIAGEMHDDLGSGLTTIRYLSDRALRNASTDDEKSQIQKIADQSNNLLRNMSEIIWALNLRNDTLENLIAYLRRYTSEYLEEHKILLRWDQDELPKDSKMSGEKRRNILLAIKEILHNLVKHAQAKEVNLNCRIVENQMQISVTDNGRGFDPTNLGGQGNGLFNLQRRMEALGGMAKIQSGKEGTHVCLIFPIDNASA